MKVNKTALYFSPIRHNYVDFCETIQRLTGIKIRKPCRLAGRGMQIGVDFAATVQEVLDRLAVHYYNLIIVDCRHLPHDEADAKGQEEALHALLDALAAEGSAERAYPFARIAVLVGDADEPRVDRLIFNMGERHVGGCLRDLSLSPRLVGELAEEARLDFFERVWSFCEKTFLTRCTGKKAIAAAGGGITGIYYELGVLKCLDDACDIGVGDFDMYFGISAGAIVTGLLANGYAIDDMIANVSGVRSDWPMRLRLSWKNLNFGALPKRILMAQQDFATYLLDAVRGRVDLNVFSALWSYERALGPMFDNSDLEEFLRQMFSRPGCTNRFDELDCELYVGATDQDRRTHVLFGDGDFKHIPISQAIQASSAAHPFFSSVEVEGHYYTDGIVTRTSNIKAAIDKGADLLFLIDPFLPQVSSAPGFNARHGNVWLVEQDLKTLAYTRFSQIRAEVLRQNPSVSAYTFVPSNRMRRLMSQNPFIGQNLHPIVCEAYRSTYRRLKQIEYNLSGELASHGIKLDLKPVEKKVKVLRKARRADVRMVLDLEPPPKKGRKSAA